MGEEVAAQVGTHANGGTRGKILCNKRAGESHRGKSDEHGKGGADYRFVTRCNAIVNNGFYHQRHQEVKNCLKELEKRADNAFFSVGLKIFQQLFHARTSFLFISE